MAGFRGIFLVLAVATCVGLPRFAAAEASPFAAAKVILETKCLECHGGKTHRAELNLTTRELLLTGGESGPAIVPSKSAESLLFKKITHADEPGMPCLLYTSPSPRDS